jgi:uncharacterized protein
MDQIVLVLITFVAATVNGALGYGFSSITVPVALLFYTNRILNPALVLVELVINSYVLFINRHSIPNIWRRVAPILIGLVIGIWIGSYVLFLVQPAWIKFVTYFFLLPLILLQAAGIRKPIKAERAIAIPFGMGIGTLYSITTISGPPLALLFNNQGYAKQDFRAALGVIRVAESSLTAIAYGFIGFYSAGSIEIIPERPTRYSPRHLFDPLDGSRNVSPHLHGVRRPHRRVWLVARLGGAQACLYLRHV